MPGPVPKRSDQRRRRNKPADGMEVTKAQSMHKVTVPDADPRWRDLPRDWFESLKDSGQSQFFENSDWQAARLLAEQMHLLLEEAEKHEGAIRAVAFKNVWDAMGDLLTTEGARRKVKVELQRGPAKLDKDKAEVVSLMKGYADMLEG